MAKQLQETIERAWAKRFLTWRGYASRFTGNGPDAEEVVQDAVARTLAASPTLRSEIEVHKYMMVVIRTSALKFIRRQRKELPVEDADRIVDSRQPSLLRLLVEDERIEIEEQAFRIAEGKLPDLPPVQRQAVELLVLREPPLKLREVAEIQGVTPAAVHYRLKRAVETLASAVNDSFGFRALPGQKL